MEDQKENLGELYMTKPPGFIDYYESKGSTIAKTYEAWLSGISPIKEQEEDKGFDMLYCQMEPKWKWFRPPFSIKIWKWEISFMWAYKIHKAAMLSNCIPVSMSTDTEDKEVDVEFSCQTLDDQRIKELTERYQGKILFGAEKEEE